MAAAISNEFQLIVPKTPESVQVKLGSDFTVLCHLSPEISAVDMEIRWFKGTDCVCIYKNRQMIEGRGYENRVNLFTNELQERGDVSLQLKNFKGTDAGLYLCQVTSESTTVKMTVQIKAELVVNNVEEFHKKLIKAFRDQCKKLEQTELKLKETAIDLEKTIKSKNHELHVKNVEMEINKKTQMKMKEQLKELQTKQTNTKKQQTATSTAKVDASNPDAYNPVNSDQTPPPPTEDASMPDALNPVKSEKTPPSTAKEDASNPDALNPVKSEQTPPTEDASMPDALNPVKSEKTPPSTGELRLFSILTGKTNNSHKKFIDTLINRFLDLRVVPTMDESDIVLVFCPIVSQVGTDIEAALKRFTDSRASKLNVLVVLHHTFDPEKSVPDSSRCVKRTDILTVDCLYYEDTGLLECQRNHDAMDKVVNWLKEQGKKRGLNVSLRQNKSSGIFSYWSLFQRR